MHSGSRSFSLWLFLGVATVLASNAAADPSGLVALDVGANSTDCGSALRLGLQTCTDPTSGAAATRIERIPNLTGVSDAANIDARIDAFLASYGKPPRSAVRALLEPTDDNIRELLAEQERTLSLAAYVAARMTSLKRAQDPLTDQAGPDPQRTPLPEQMRILLFQRPDDTSTRDTVAALAILARIAPSLQAGIRIVGPIESSHLKDVIGHIDPALSVDVAPAEQVDLDALPFVRIEDTKAGHVYTVDAHGLRLGQMREALYALRAGGLAGEAHRQGDRE